MYSYTATIGRNLTSFVYDERDTHQDGEPTRVQVPMSEQNWADFVDTIEAHFAGLILDWQDADAVVETHRGTGIWDGVEEESAKITLLSSGTMNPTELGQTRVLLNKLANKYNQEAIAFTIGESELITWG